MKIIIYLLILYASFMFGRIIERMAIKEEELSNGCKNVD